MKKRMYWKTIRNILLQSKSRFLSILLLMFLGSFTFIGLKTAGPNMQALATDYLHSHRTADLFVIANYGFSKDDRSELDSIKNAEIDYGKMTDMTIKGTDDAIRLFSDTRSVSSCQLVSGRLPKKKQRNCHIVGFKKEIQDRGNTDFPRLFKICCKEDKV